MSIVETDLNEVLHFREQRLEIQRKLISQYQLPIVSFTMNIAGPVKRSALIDYVFSLSVYRIFEELGRPLYFRTESSTAGSEAFFVYDREPRELKAACIRIEEQDAAGRLLDIDVINTSGEKLSRPEGRRCIVCGGPVELCARSRAHGLDSLRAKTAKLLYGCVSDYVSSLAVKALTDEAALTPKPGLVDRLDSGAHRDMDYRLMETSARTLEPYFRHAVELGLTGGDSLPAQLQSSGKNAEKEMFRATGGVNTHKGAIYIMGLLCAALGAVLAEREEDVFSTAAAVSKQLSVDSEPSHGSIVRKSFPDTGPRAEAFSGFPNVQRALAQLHDGTVGRDVLLSLISSLPDSNILWRGGADGLRFMQEGAASILNAPVELRDSLVSQLNSECIRRNLSPGGSADLFAAALFLYSVDTAHLI